MSTPQMAEDKKVLYTAKTHTTGGREHGIGRSSDGRLDVKLSIPGSAGTGTNPEQLFAVGWSGCFEESMKIVARTMKIHLPEETSLDAEVDLCLRGGNDYFLQARLNITIPGLERNVAQSIVDAAENVCTYSKAIRGNVDVTIKLV
jgi:osmotically inducible protein OsmC